MACRPFMPGIRMSIRTTSGRCSATACSAAAPSPASAPPRCRPAGRGSSAGPRGPSPGRRRSRPGSSRRPSPAVVTGTSVTGRTAATRKPPCRTRPRPQACRRTGAARSRMPISPWPARRGARRRSGAVVGDLDPQRVRGVLQPDAGSAGARVPAGVGQRLLHDPVGGQVDARAADRRGSPSTSTSTGRPTSAASCTSRADRSARAAARSTTPARRGPQNAEQPPHLGQRLPAGLLHRGAAARGRPRVSA